jgi:hypothetical protein
MIARRLTLVILAAVCALTGVLALSGASAQALVIHEYLSQITEIPAQGPHGEPVPEHGAITRAVSMTVDSGDLYAVEEPHGEGGGLPSPRTDVFDASSGAFLLQMDQPPSLFNFLDRGIAVGHGTPETQVYVGGQVPVGGSSQAGVAVFGATGHLLGSWSGADTPGKTLGSQVARGVAVDHFKGVGDWAQGDVYVGVTGNEESEDVVDVFKPEAGGAEEYLTQLTGESPTEHFGEVKEIAVDEANGDLLVANVKTVEGKTVEVIDIFAPKPTELEGYEFVRALTGPQAPSAPWHREIDRRSLRGGAHERADRPSAVIDGSCARHGSAACGT